MQVMRTESMVRICWVMMFVVVSAILAGCPEKVLKECVVQVLFLVSCAVASAAVKPHFARGNVHHLARDIEQGPEPVRSWTVRQLYSIIIGIMAIDASILASDPSEVVPRLLLAGLLVLWYARYLAPTALSAYMTIAMTSLSTAILQAMLWEVGRPISTLQDASDPLRLFFTLTVTILLMLRQFGCESYLVLVMWASQAPHLLLECMKVYSAWTGRSARILAKRLDTSALAISFVGPVPTTICVIAASGFLYWLGVRAQNRRNEPAAIMPDNFQQGDVIMVRLPPMPQPVHARDAGTEPARRTHEVPDNPREGRYYSLHRGLPDTNTFTPTLDSQTTRFGTTSIGAGAAPGRPDAPSEPPATTSDKVADGPGLSSSSDGSHILNTGKLDDAGSVQRITEPQSIKQLPSLTAPLDPVSLPPLPDDEGEDYDLVEASELETFEDSLHWQSSGSEAIFDVSEGLTDDEE